MLSRIFIQNYVLIDEIGIDFSAGLNVITGETGAGKSILVGALGLILGERADTTTLVNKEKKCIVEGVFQAENKSQVRDFLAAYELDAGTELVLRREIAVNGKSRAFINDTPVSLAQLQELSTLLVDLHQQFDTLQLARNDFQREVLDALAGHASLLEEYRHVFTRWQQMKKETGQLQEQQEQLEKEADYNRFQFSELEEAGFSENELEEGEAELKRLNNSEGIKAALDKVQYGLQEGESPVVQQLKILSGQLTPFISYHPQLPELLQRLQSAQVELADISGDLEQINRQINHDPSRMETLQERLSLGYRLMKKHGVRDTAGLLAIQTALDQKLQAVQNMDELIRQKETETKKLQEDVIRLAEKISAGRKKQIRPLEEKVNKLLVQVGMPNAKFCAEARPAASPHEQGIDDIGFLFDANQSGQFQPLRKVASGGELSRLMLCIKSLVAQSIDLPTLIFDEIDSGISGEAARQVSLIMKGLAANRQVICITHQPRIAGKADTHFFVYKEIVRDQVKTNIRKLDTEERITAIAKMLSGEKPTAAALANAREMLMN